MSTPAVPSTSGRPSISRRPRNRKALILDAAARAFAERGYHAVGMEDIAIAVGISGPALYRHFPSKYALFADCARSLASELLDDWPPAPLGVDLDEPAAARAHLDDVLAALIRTTVRNRRTGGIYRWEGRYLEPGDREEIRAIFAELVARVAALVRVLRPEMSESEVGFTTAGSLSVVASLTAHRTTLPARRLSSLVSAAAIRVAVETPPDVPTGDGDAAEVSAVGLELAPGRRDQVLAAAVRLFYSVGFSEVTVEAIATDVGLTPSGFYRHFSSKSDVLLAACLLASEHLDATVAAAGVRGAAPDVALDRLTRAYIAHTFAHKELMSVYYSDVASLPSGDQSKLRGLQREHVALWEHLLVATRPGLDPVEARFLVHAAIGVVTDLGRRVRWRDDPATQERVHGLVLLALGVHGTVA
ncbi:MULTISPECIES: TetR/AcrR family transcriptional regulator [Mumia]|uniref:TetR/AcrR family transcriptional regulator n=1 Tax=Mumia xiangluensis TaxID=1678900 RepID=A0ABW1QS80_9ACTN|nr:MULTISPECIES: TetR/AcrR family transcriptional regulator [Mumia]